MQLSVGLQRRVEGLPTPAQVDDSHSQRAAIMIPPDRYAWLIVDEPLGSTFTVPHQSAPPATP